jgi:hypothetical protein
VLAVVATDRSAAEPRERTGPKEVEIVKLVNATWNCQDKIPTSRSPVHRDVRMWHLERHTLAFRIDIKNRWQEKLNACRAVLKKRAYEWNWQVSIPQWARDLARCESSYNWWAEASSRDGVFYSAFNISRSQYDKDAHYMGVRGWREGPGVPSPVEQTMAVIGHMRLLGDGFTGNCHGIARSSW